MLFSEAIRKGAETGVRQIRGAYESGKGVDALGAAYVGCTGLKPSQASLEDLSEEKALLGEINRVLKQNGISIMDTLVENPEPKLILIDRMSLMSAAIYLSDSSKLKLEEIADWFAERGL